LIQDYAKKSVNDEATAYVKGNVKAKNQMAELEEHLNLPTSYERLKALKELMSLYKSGEIELPPQGNNVNNHIHTTYSFSPYSPTMAAYLAWKNGLATAGIMDHDSVGGLKEFIEAGQIIGIKVTVGFEFRCSFEDTKFAGKRINNPDQKSIAYLAMHGIPHHKIDEAESFLRPYREKRNARNRLMVDKLNRYIRKSELALDFNKDVMTLSQYQDGGTITERHILYALAGKILDKVAKGPTVPTFLYDNFGIKVTGSNLSKLNNPDTLWYQYYLLGELKANFVEKFYIDATDELPSYKDFITLGKSLGAIPAYPYLGDVQDSVTGDKKSQKFEDDYLDEWVAFIKDAGFKAITYMPTRNTKEQVRRMVMLCNKYQLFQICGEDINSPFQPFICQALEEEEFRHLITAAWALIGHENSLDGMFKEGTPLANKSLEERIDYFANIGMNLSRN